MCSSRLVTWTLINDEIDLIPVLKIPTTALLGIRRRTSPSWVFLEPISLLCFGTYLNIVFEFAQKTPGCSSTVYNLACVWACGTRPSYLKNIITRGGLVMCSLLAVLDGIWNPLVLQHQPCGKHWKTVLAYSDRICIYVCCPGGASPSLEFFTQYLVILLLYLHTRCMEVIQTLFPTPTLRALIFSELLSSIEHHCFRGKHQALGAWCPTFLFPFFRVSCSVFIVLMISPPWDRESIFYISCDYYFGFSTRPNL